MPIRSALPIQNNTIKLNPVACKHEDLLNLYTETFSNWMINGSSKLKGFDQFSHTSFCHGSVQAFDHFYLKHHNRRMRFFQGEFVYHQVCIKNAMPWCYINDDPIDKNDAVIVSFPFSDLGDVHPEMTSLMKICVELNIPVLVDLSYLCISKDLNIDLSYSCIETVTSSISKAFHGAQFLRAGIRWQRHDLDDGIDFFNKNYQVPTHSLACAVDFMKNYSLDWNWNVYGDIYNTVINDLNLSPTKCILFGIGGGEYQEFNRGNTWNRVCISNEIGERYVRMQSQ
jgi:hypothetical protein